MTDVKALRDKLAEVDRQRAIERSAESARCSIRLGQRPLRWRGLLGFRDRDRDWFFTPDETNAIYDALAVVRDDAQRRATEIEKQIEGGDA